MPSYTFAGPWSVLAKNGGAPFSIIIEGGSTTQYTGSITQPLRVPASGGATATWSIQTSAPMSRTVTFTDEGLDVFYANVSGPELVIHCKSLDTNIQIPTTGSQISFTLPGGGGPVTHG